jgi:hypothetical protein
MSDAAYIGKCSACGLSGKLDGSARCNQCHQNMAVLEELRTICNTFYRLCFTGGIGTSCHAFLEFTGLMSKYIDVISRAAAEGIAPNEVNQHVGTKIKVHDHDIKYMAEKLSCIFRPIIAANPNAAKIIREELGV